MAFNRPSLATIIDRVKNDLESRLGISGASLRRSFVAVVARVIAGISHMLYSFIEWVYKQMLPDTADKEQLIRWAAIFGIRLKEASFARLSIVATGVNSTSIPAQTGFRRSDGVEYTTVETASVSGGEATLTVICASPGANGNCDEGVELQLISPIAGLDSTATVDSTVENGADEESADLLLERLLNRIQEPPRGGSKNDYETWAKEVAGVTRAWCYPGQFGMGTVGVTFVMDEREDSILPETEDVDLVQEYIDDRRPVTAEVTVYAPIENSVDFEINLNPDTVAIRTAVTAELKDLFKRTSSPGTTTLLSQMNEAISIAEGEFDHTIVSPSADVVPAATEINVLGEIDWGT